MQRHLLLTLLFTLQIIQSAEQLAIDNNIVAATVAFGHHHFDTPTFYGMKLLSKPFKKFISSQEDNFYSITISKDGKETASVRLICPECFLESCAHNTKKYRGWLRRSGPGGQYHNAYLITSQIVPLVNVKKSIRDYQHILNPNTIATIPNDCSPQPISTNEQGPDNRYEIYYFHYDQISRPYYISDTDEVGVLEGISRLTRAAERHRNIIPNLGTVYECSIATNGVCNNRQVYFKLDESDDDEKRYSFGLLGLLPCLYTAYLTLIENQSCNCSRNNESTTFTHSSFYEKYLSKDQLREALDTLLNVIDWLEVYSQSDDRRCCYASYYDKIQGKRKEDKAEKKNRFLRNSVKNDITTLVRLAFCANRCGNKRLAIDILGIYDHFEEMPLNAAQLETNHCSHIALLPLGGIAKTCRCWRVCDSSIKASDYAALESLTDIALIPKVLAHIRARRQLKALAYNVFVEITKDNNAYTINPWHYCDTEPDSIYPAMNWVCGKKFVLQNCTGTIKTARPSSSFWRKVEDIDSITVIEEQSGESGIKKEITHILRADQITDATESTAENKLIQRPVNNNNFLAILFRITQLTNIFTWTWNYLFAAKR
jgi:hypothetical protein